MGFLRGVPFGEQRLGARDLLIGGFGEGFQVEELGTQRVQRLLGSLNLRGHLRPLSRSCLRIEY